MLIFIVYVLGFFLRSHNLLNVAEFQYKLASIDWSTLNIFFHLSIYGLFFLIHFDINSIQIGQILQTTFIGILIII